MGKIKDRGNIAQQTGTKFGRAQLHHLKNITNNFQKNLKSSLGGDVITRL